MPWLRVALVVPIWIAALGVAHAEGLEPPSSGDERRALILKGSQVQPTREDVPDVESPQRPSWLEHVHIRKGAGLEVRRSMAIGHKPVVVGLKGPVMKRKRLGLALEVRF